MQTSDIPVPAPALTAFATDFLAKMGCPQDVAIEVAAHLVDSDLVGVFSHGTVRLPQYLEQSRKGLFDPTQSALMTTAEGGGALADGRMGFGQPASRIATEAAVAQAQANGLGAAAVANCGHTGRMGAFADLGAEAGCLTMILGGGGREEWRQVAPFGGKKGLLPTNPYAFSIPGGDRGVVGFDFATSAAAGGKVLAAKSAGRMLPEGCIIDAHGNPSVDPDDYNNGGALLPAAGPKGYGMALLAELVGEAVYGTCETGMNWLVVCVDLARFRGASAYQAAAEAALEEARTADPAPGFDRVEIPGERERALKAHRLTQGIPVPPGTLEILKASAAEIGANPDLLTV
ncbi:MAG: Ldh family oxidoreductase [Pseudomonadota bacterium]